MVTNILRLVFNCVDYPRLTTANAIQFSFIHICVTEVTFEFFASLANTIFFGWNRNPDFFLLYCVCSIVIFFFINCFNLVIHYKSGLGNVGKVHITHSVLICLANSCQFLPVILNFSGFASLAVFSNLARAG